MVLTTSSMMAVSESTWKPQVTWNVPEVIQEKAFQSSASCRWPKTCTKRYMLKTHDSVTMARLTMSARRRSRLLPKRRVMRKPAKGSTGTRAMATFRMVLTWTSAGTRYPFISS